MDAVNWIMTNGHQLLEIVTTAIALASLIAAITPSPKDDSVIAKIRSLVDVIALNIGFAKKK